MNRYDQSPTLLNSYHNVSIDIIIVPLWAILTCSQCKGSDPVAVSLDGQSRNSFAIGTYNNLDKYSIVAGKGIPW